MKEPTTWKEVWEYILDIINLFCSILSSLAAFCLLYLILRGIPTPSVIIGYIGCVLAAIANWMVYINRHPKKHTPQLKAEKITLPTTVGEALGINEGDQSCPKE